jgi:hypothetical protein
MQVARAAQNVKSMINVLVAAVPGFVNVLALIGLVVFMYAYIGVYLFGKLMWGSVSREGGREGGIPLCNTAILFFVPGHIL